jgi:2,3-dihydroxybiphenyl 1,2-dioxygenase
MISSLAYIGFTSPHAEEWRSFGPDVLGAELAPDGPDGAVRLRVDDVDHRITVHPGERDDLAYLGWLVDDLDATVAAIEAAGVTVSTAEPRSFVDPFGFRHELVAALDHGVPFMPGRPMAGFVTGAQGLGHVVLLVPDLDDAERFVTAALGLRRTDTVEGGGLDLRFFHCPGSAARHHTLAFAAVPGVAGLHHLMLEVTTLDDVGTALDVVGQREIPLAMSLGRHTNDLMTSFYVRTPSGFEIEYGTGGIVVDDDTWTTGTHASGSRWGHHPPDTGPLRPKILRPVGQPT